jgi:hypothetical protein
MTTKFLADKKLVVDKLKDGVCTITFEKKDGALRKMKCTLNSELIPKLEIIESKEKKTRAENPEVLPVYDIEAAGWRSFRWDSLIEFEGKA